MTSAAGETGIRRSARELVLWAAEVGLEHPQNLLKCTPVEIEAELQAANARRDWDLQQLDLLAWLAGRYMLMGMHAPRRYPRRPECIRRTHAPMNDMDMKQVFAAMAARRRDEVGSG